MHQRPCQKASTHRPSDERLRMFRLSVQAEKFGEKSHESRVADRAIFEVPSIKRRMDSAVAETDTLCKTCNPVP